MRGTADVKIPRLSATVVPGGHGVAGRFDSVGWMAGVELDLPDRYSTDWGYRGQTSALLTIFP